MRAAIKAVAGAAALAFVLAGCGSGAADQSTPEGAMKGWLQAMADSKFEDACKISLDEDRVPFQEGTDRYTECVAGFGTISNKFGADRFQQMLDLEPAREGDGDRVDFSWNPDAGNVVALDEMRVRKIDDKWYVEDAR